MKKVLSTLLLSCMFAMVSCLQGHEASEFFKDPDVLRLAEAAQRGDIKKIDQLVAKGVDVNSKAKDNMTPLFWSMITRNKNGFKRLLEHGANPNIPTNTGSSVMTFAARCKDSTYLIEALNHGGDPNYFNKISGRVLLLESIGSGIKGNIKILINSGADLNGRSYMGDTPLMYAALINQFDIVHDFLQEGADYNAKNKNADSIVTYIETSRLNEKAKRERQKVIDFLKERGVEVNVPPGQ